MNNGFKAIFRYYDGLNLSHTDIDITLSTINGRDLSISAQRDGFSGVVSEIKLDLEIQRGGAIEILKTIYEDYRVQGGVYGNVFVVLTIENKINKAFSVNLSTYSCSPIKFTVNIENPLLMDFINTNGDTEYLCPVGDIDSKVTLNYQAMDIACEAKYELPLSIQQENEYPSFKEEATIITCGIDFSSIIGFEGVSNWFFKSQRSTAINITKTLIGFPAQLSGLSFLSPSAIGNPSPLTFKMGFEVHLWMEENPSNVRFGVIETANYTISPTFPFENSVSYLGKTDKSAKDWDGVDVGRLHHYVSIVDAEMTLDTAGYTSLPEYTLGFICYSTNIIPKTSKARVKVKTFSKFKATWTQKSTGQQSSNITLSAVRIDALMNEIFKKAGKTNFMAIVELEEEFDNVPMLVASEDANGKINPAYHAKFADLIKMLHVMGYEYVIDESEHIIIFKRRHVIYDITEYTEIFPRNKANLQLSHDRDNTYSSLKIGYSKTDHDSITGKLDPVGVANFSTGRELPQSKILEMVSSVRADLFGLEYATWQRYKSDDNDKTDSDIFLVDCKQTGVRQYKVWDVIQVTCTDTVGNVAIFNNALRTPYASIMGINKDFLFSWAKKYTFADGEVYKDMPALYSANPMNYDGFSTLSTAERGNIVPLFKQMTLSLDYGSIDTPDFNKAYKVEFEGDVIYGFAKESEYNPITKRSNELNLIIRNIDD